MVVDPDPEAVTRRDRRAGVERVREAPDVVAAVELWPETMTRGDPIDAASAQMRSNASASSIDAQEWVLVTASPASASAERAAATSPPGTPTVSTPA